MSAELVRLFLLFAALARRKEALRVQADLTPAEAAEEEAVEGEVV